MTNDLLLELNRIELFVYELKKTIAAKQRPIVMITWNNERGAAGCVPAPLLLATLHAACQTTKTMQQIVEVHFPPGLKQELVQEALTIFFDVREVPGLKRGAVDLGAARLAEAAAGRGHLAGDLATGATRKSFIPPLHGALLKNEQDVRMFRAAGVLPTGASADEKDGPAYRRRIS